MRTFLTMLGVIIGVSSVIMIFSAGNAGKAYINGLFGKLGANIINISTSATANIEESDKFTLKDVEYLKANIEEADIIKEKYSLEKDSYILFLGRIVPEKGLHYLIEAFKQIKTDKKLVIAGKANHSERI